MQIRSVGIDLGKTSFHLVALGDNGKVLLKKKSTQKQLIAFTANMQTCLIGMEACCKTHISLHFSQANRWANVDHDAAHRHSMKLGIRILLDRSRLQQELRAIYRAASVIP
jgi:hypothetical protein